MSAKIFVGGLLALSIVVGSNPTQAQQPGKFPRIGFLTSNSSSAELPRVEQFRQGLRALGHIEGQNIAIEYRYTDGKFDRLPEIAAELIGLKIDVLVAVTTMPAVAAKNATKTIPIVIFGVSDPVAAGLVDSLARPGGNITGLTNIAPALSAKRLELLKETVPKLSRAAVLWNPQSLGDVPQWKESELAAAELGLQLYSMEVSSPDKYESAFKAALRVRSAALAVTTSASTNVNRKLIVDLAMKNRLPAIYPWGDFVDAGGLMSYGPIFAAAGRDAARLVDKILKGAKPGDLPVEQPKKFEFIVNLKAAKQIGLTIPPAVIYQADKVIK